MHLPYTLHKFLFALTLIFCPLYAVEHSNLNEPPPIFVRHGDELTVPENSPLRKRLVISPVKEVESPHIITVPGVVEADPARVVNILPPLIGRLVELKVDLGDVVKENQVLAVIHSPDLDLAYSDLDKARDALDFAKKSLERAQNVNTIGANAIKDLEQATSNHNQAIAEFKRAEARLNTLAGSSGVNDKRELVITTPISGTVTALNVGLGSYINDPTATLMTISNLSHIWVTANLPEDLLAGVNPGDAVEVALYAYPGQKFPGKISFINAVLEPDTHRNKARVMFDNPDNRLKPNMFAIVGVAVPQTPQIVVPTSALLMNNDNTTVFVETTPWTFVRRIVVLGHEDGTSVRILSGLKAGEQIVTSGGVLLND